MVSNQNVLNQLQDLGFSNHEGSVYLSIIQTGSASTGDIVQATGLHREQIYRSLSRLEQKGLIVSRNNSKKERYQAADPSILVDLIEAKKKTAQSVEKTLRKLYQGQSQNIQVREGRESLKLLMDDILKIINRDGEYLILGGAWREFYRQTKEYLPTYHRALQKKNIGGRILSYQGHEAEDETKLGWHIAVRVLDEPNQNIASTIIYGNKVAIEVLDPDNIAVITIQNNKVAEHYRQTFETLWKLGKQK